jgi:hypothetical protein
MAIYRMYTMKCPDFGDVLKMGKCSPPPGVKGLLRITGVQNPA